MVQYSNKVVVQIIIWFVTIKFQITQYNKKKIIVTNHIKVKDVSERKLL